MPTWGELLIELNQLISSGDPTPHDTLRRKYLIELYQKTKRNVILYASAWTQTGKHVDPGLLSINEEDLQGLMEVVHGLRGKKLDLIIHSPGGSPTATEALVTYLRTKFNDIRVIIPHAAMSAATMLACSANSIVMGKHSFIGPIDPQMILQTKLGVRAVPAQDILDQFDKAQKECESQEKLASWFPILEQYGPDLITQCENAIKLSEDLVSEWLSKYMLKNKPDSKKLACKIAKYLSDHRVFKTHSRHISRKTAIRKGLVIEKLETDQDFQDLVLSVYHATTLTLSSTGAVKLFENQHGKAFIKQVQQVVVSGPPVGPVPLRPGGNPPGQPSGNPPGP